MDSAKAERNGGTDCPPQTGAGDAGRNGSIFQGGRLFAPRRRFDASNPELIDRPETDRELLWEELRVLEATNRRFGAHELMIEQMERFAPKAGETLEVLDLCTGGADIPRAIAAWARQRQVKVSITAVDGNPKVMRFAEESCKGWPEIRLMLHDVRDLPFVANSFDVVLCSLALHHFDETNAVGILRRMGWLARRGYVMNDLRRNWVSLWMTNVLTWTVMRRGLMRNDAPQSCRAAFTVDELKRMAREAGLKNFEVKRQQGFFRMTLEGRK